jgi:hypothetical protein
MSGGCESRETKDSGRRPGDGLPVWSRKFFQATPAKALIWYQVYGRFSNTIEISGSRYRCGGFPEAIDVSNYGRGDHEDVVTGFLNQPFFATGLKRDFPKLAQEVETAPECTIIRGEIPDSANLDYLRDTVGLVTWFLDNGGLAVLDPQTLTWYDRENWRAKLFEPGTLVPAQHVVILYSDEHGTGDKKVQWLHTRGMRKFARPDISVRDVPMEYRDGVIDLMKRLIELQALGRVVAEGQPISIKSLPAGMICRHTGNLDDPDFNNVHIEIGWPE